MKGIFLFLLFIFNFNVQAESFNELLLRLNEHDLLKSAIEKASSLEENARSLGSWGDPNVSIAALNFPADSLKQNESMMTGIQFSLSQKISLSGKYGAIEESQLAAARGQINEVSHLKRTFIKKLWELSIFNEKLINEHKVLLENYDWIDNNLKVTKRLYSTGKVPQQAVLDIQIRKSELKTQIDQNSFTQESLKYQFRVLLNSKDNIELDLSSVPWKLLDDWKRGNEDNDYKEKSLKSNVENYGFKLSAHKKDLFPDLTLGFSYTKRNDIDGVGDFVGVKISFPIPTSSKKYATKNEMAYLKAEAERKYRHYQNIKPNLLNIIESEIEDANNRLETLQKESLRYSKSSRDITAKSYSRGGAEYLELLRAELQYQEQRMKEISLIAVLKERKVNYLFLKGSLLALGGEL